MGKDSIVRADRLQGWVDEHKNIIVEAKALKFSIQ
jgi:hypothetical protein